MKNPAQHLLTVKELAREMGVCRGYVWAMRAMGFPKRLATLDEAFEWLRNNPAFRVRLAWK